MRDFLARAQAANRRQRCSQRERRHRLRRSLEMQIHTWSTVRVHGHCLFLPCSHSGASPLDAQTPSWGFFASVAGRHSLTSQHPETLWKMALPWREQPGIPTAQRGVSVWLLFARRDASVCLLSARRVVCTTCRLSLAAVCTTWRLSLAAVRATWRLSLAVVRAT